MYLCAQPDPAIHGKMTPAGLQRQGGLCSLGLAALRGRSSGRRGVIVIVIVIVIGGEEGRSNHDFRVVCVFTNR